MMAANNRSGMRPTGRSPPFLAIGLTVALVILGFNYWSLSARNGEQADEIAVLESEMRLINAKKLSAEKRSETISDKVKDLEGEVNKQKAVVADKMAQLSTFAAEKENLMSEKQKCDADYQSCSSEQLPACQKEKENLQSELEQVKASLEAEKNQVREDACDEGKCSSFSDQARDKVLGDLYSLLGSGPLVALHQKGISVGQFEPQIAQMAAQSQQQQQQVNQMAGQINQAALPIVKSGQDLPTQQQQQPQPAPDAAGDLNQKLTDLHNAGAQPAEDKQADVGAQEQEQENAMPQVPNPLDNAQPRPDGAEQPTENDRIYPDQAEPKKEVENQDQGNQTMSTTKPGSREIPRSANKLGDRVVGSNMAGKAKAPTHTYPTTSTTTMGTGNRTQARKVIGNQSTNTSTEGPRIEEERSGLNIARHNKSVKASLKHAPGDVDENEDEDFEDENPDDVYDNEDEDDEDDEDDADGNADDPQNDDVLRVLPQDDDYDDEDEDDYNYKEENMDDLQDQNDDPLADLHNTEDEVDQMRANLEDPISDH